MRCRRRWVPRGVAVAGWHRAQRQRRGRRTRASTQLSVVTSCKPRATPLWASTGVADVGMATGLSRRLRALVRAVGTAAADGEKRPQDVITAPPAEDLSGVEDDGSGLPVIPWGEIMQHRFLADIWVVIDGYVYDMTEFISSDTHPGGEEIPLQYAGKDATDFWLDTHGHLLDEIMKDLENDNGQGGAGENTFLEMLPKRIGRTTGRPPIEAQVYSTKRQHNWGGNVSWAAHGAVMAEPETLEELCEVVAAASHVRVLGQGHSFVPICHVSTEEGTMISLSKMCAVLDLDAENMTVTVEGGINYSQLTGYLSSDARPFALANVQSHPSFTVAGTLATASHGSSAIDPVCVRARVCVAVWPLPVVSSYETDQPSWRAGDRASVARRAGVSRPLLPDGV